MSTLTKLLAHEADQPPKLVRFRPRLIGSEKEQRKVSMTTDLHEWLMKPVKSKTLLEIKARARAHFGQFVKGEYVDDLYFMKRVEDRRMTPFDFSHEVWSVSPRFGEPQYRFFGAFVTQDWFLAICKQDRSRLGEHANRWHDEINRVIRTWRSFFGDDLRHSGHQLADYIRINAHHSDDRWG
jgi:hypothetical protein